MLEQRGFLVVATALVFVAAVPLELGSESLSLHTYYPSPLGIYTQMTTTGNTLLARDGGRVGVGTVAPAAKLHVVAAGGFGNEPIRAQASSTFFSGVDGGGAPRYAINNDVLAGVRWLDFYGWDGAWFNFMGVNNSGGRQVFFPGAVGVGAAGPQQGLSVGSGENVDQSNLNNGFLNQNGAQGNGLSFGSGSGEGLASKRTGGGNQYGLDFYSAFVPRMRITNSGDVQVLGRLALGGVAKNAWPAPQVSQRWSPGTQGRHWFSASVACGAGEVLMGCSGYYTQICSPGSPNGIDDVCGYNGSYPTGNTCVAWAYEGNNQGHGTLNAIASCLYLSP